MNMGNVILTLAAINAVLYENGKDRKIAFGTRARLARIRDIFEKEAEVYEKERVRLVKEFGDESEKDGEKVLEVTDPEKLKSFYSALEVILKTEIDVEYKKLTQKELAAIDELEIEISDAQLQMFFEFVVDAA